MSQVAYLFAGQGSQYVGMGKDLYESFPQARKIFDTADKVLGFSVTKLCFEGPQEELTITANCQPAILTMSIAAWEAFGAREGRRSPPKADPPMAGPVAGYAAGLSLGEYSALVAAGALDFADAVVLVRKRGQFMEEEALKKPGAMASIIGLDRDTVTEFALENGVEIANLNCPGQTVISGSTRAVEKAQLIAKDKGAKLVVRLDVSGAFHSSLMKGAASRLEAELAGILVRKPQIPVITNVTANIESEPAQIRANLVKQLSGSVLWEDSMRFALGQGVKTFYEFGPGKVLKGLMRRIDPGAEVVTIEKAEDIRGLGTGN